MAPAPPLYPVADTAPHAGRDAVEIVDGQEADLERVREGRRVDRTAGPEEGQDRVGRVVGHDHGAAIGSGDGYRVLLPVGCRIRGGVAEGEIGVAVTVEVEKGRRRINVVGDDDIGKIDVDDRGFGLEGGETAELQGAGGEGFAGREGHCGDPCVETGRNGRRSGDRSQGVSAVAP